MDQVQHHQSLAGFQTGKNDNNFDSFIMQLRFVILVSLAIAVGSGQAFSVANAEHKAEKEVLNVDLDKQAFTDMLEAFLFDSEEQDSSARSFVRNYRSRGIFRMAKPDFLKDEVQFYF